MIIYTKEQLQEFARDWAKKGKEAKETIHQNINALYDEDQNAFERTIKDIIDIGYDADPKEFIRGGKALFCKTALQNFIYQRDDETFKALIENYLGTDEALTNNISTDKLILSPKSQMLFRLMKDKATEINNPDNLASAKLPAQIMISIIIPKLTSSIPTPEKKPLSSNDIIETLKPPFRIFSFFSLTEEEKLYVSLKKSTSDKDSLEKIQTLLSTKRRLSILMEDSDSAKLLNTANFLFSNKIRSDLSIKIMSKLQDLMKNLEGAKQFLENNSNLEKAPTATAEENEDKITHESETSITRPFI